MGGAESFHAPLCFDIYARAMPVEAEEKGRERAWRIFSHENNDGSSNASEVLEAILNQTLIIAKATNFVRNLVNQTPDDMTPQGMAVVADACDVRLKKLYNNH